MKILFEVCITVNQLEVRLLFNEEPRLEHVIGAIVEVFKGNQNVCVGLCRLVSALGDSDLVLHPGAEAHFEQDEKRIGSLIVQPRTLFEVQ